MIKDLNSINSSNRGIKFNSINHGKNGFNLFLVEAEGNNLAEGVEKVNIDEKIIYRKQSMRIKSTT